MHKYSILIKHTHILRLNQRGSSIFIKNRIYIFINETWEEECEGLSKWYLTIFQNYESHLWYIQYCKYNTYVMIIYDDFCDAETEIEELFNLVLEYPGQKQRCYFYISD